MTDTRLLIESPGLVEYRRLDRADFTRQVAWPFILALDAEVELVAVECSVAGARVAPGRREDVPMPVRPAGHLRIGGLGTCVDHKADLAGLAAYGLLVVLDGFDVCGRNDVHVV